MLNIIIFGPPGSGKGTQSARIVEKYNLLHLSTGDILRDEMEKETAVGLEAKKYIDKGHLVPDEVVLKVLYHKASDYASGHGFVFDGFPRTIVQAEILDKMLEKRKMPINIVISIEVKEDELFKRMMGRAEDSGRSDDNEETIRKRIEVYKQQTFPLIDYYRNQGKLVDINGMDSVDKVFSNISRAIDFFIMKKEILP
ncbi:MAG: adenylate kinase [Bacteroidales bacterium]